MSAQTIFPGESSLRKYAPATAGEATGGSGKHAPPNLPAERAPQAAPTSTKRQHPSCHTGIVLLAAVVTSGAVALAAYGFDYYRLSVTERPYSVKHLLLKPSGAIGFWLGVAGALAFVAVFAYPLRKRWSWLSRQGDTRNWLDMHVLLGLAAPGLILLHCAFKFRGVAGMAFWIMAAVALSGIVGRYLFAQIPRSLSAAELSLQEAGALQENLTAQLSAQTLLTAADLQPLFRLPTAEKIAGRSALSVLCSLIAVDILRPLHVARLRQRLLSSTAILFTAGGLFPGGGAKLEPIIEIARRQAALSKRILFLSRTQQVFHLWHVVHRPFSYTLLALAGLHILVVILFFGVR